ncbi:MAG: glycosyltransferase family 2 protein [Omnitrophica bacterium]|nr:glycosyltransferase family 2 protein [Candidatus Omnitrophota bacterium]
MKIAFWCFSGLILFIYFLFPIIIFIIAKIKGRDPQQSDIAPFVSFIIALHNEEKVIREKLKNTLSLDYPQDRLEIIFALDGCTDKTKEIISECGNGRIRILDNKQRRGKVATLNRVVGEAKGEIVVFSDANSIHQKDTLRKLIRNFSDQKVGCVCGRLKYTGADSTSVGKGESLYWRYEHFVKTQESKLGKLLITNGSIQALRKHLYPYPDPEIADDFSVPLLIQARGYKILYEPQAVVYETATQSLKEEFRQKVRIVSQGIKGAIRLRKDLLRLRALGLFELLFHKLLRWFIPFFLIAVFAFNLTLVQDKLYFYLFILQLIFYFFAFIGFLLQYSNKIKVFYIPFYFCLVNFASLVAFFWLLSGGETRMWEKAYSTRSNK